MTREAQVDSIVDSYENQIKSITSKLKIVQDQSNETIEQQETLIREQQDTIAKFDALKKEFFEESAIQRDSAVQKTQTLEEEVLTLERGLLETGKKVF